jgi:hypothetical protein
MGGIKLTLDAIVILVVLALVAYEGVQLEVAARSSKSEHGDEGQLDKRG